METSDAPPRLHRRQPVAAPGDLQTGDQCSGTGGAGVVYVARLLILPASRCAAWGVIGCSWRHRPRMARRLLEPPGLARPVRPAGMDAAAKGIRPTPERRGLYAGPGRQWLGDGRWLRQ